jgi:hypothetical protein
MGQSTGNGCTSPLAFENFVRIVIDLVREPKEIQAKARVLVDRLVREPLASSVCRQR